MIPDSLLQILSVSMVFSVILMAFIQKLKILSIIKKKNHIWYFNFLFSFLLGIPFGMIFYQLKFEQCIWIGIFSFIGASSIYDTLKAYQPVSLSQTIIKNK